MVISGLISFLTKRLSSHKMKEHGWQMSLFKGLFEQQRLSYFVEKPKYIGKSYFENRNLRKKCSTLANVLMVMKKYEAIQIAEKFV